MQAFSLVLKETLPVTVIASPAFEAVVRKLWNAGFRAVVELRDAELDMFTGECAPAEDEVQWSHGHPLLPLMGVFHVHLSMPLASRG